MLRAQGIGYFRYFGCYERALGGAHDATNHGIVMLFVCLSSVTAPVLVSLCGGFNDRPVTVTLPGV